MRAAIMKLELKTNVQEPQAGINRLLAASGQTVELLSDLLNIYIDTDENGESNASVKEIVNVWRRVVELKTSLENIQATCASGAVATVAEGWVATPKPKVPNEVRKERLKQKLNARKSSEGQP